MPFEINARGLECPQPIIMARKALIEHQDIVILVDGETALENLKRLGEKMGCAVQISSPEKGVHAVHLVISGSETGGMDLKDLPMECDAGPGEGQGPLVVVFSGDAMGQGDDELGRLLMKAFIHTLLEAEKSPQTVICYNSGVKLAAKDADTAADLRELENRGTEVLICGTCVNFYNLKERLGAGKISNMYDIVNVMNGAGKVIRP